MFTAALLTVIASGPVTIELADPKRPKPLVVRVYPSQVAGKQPVVVFSHGFKADETAFAPICQYWADHGYTVLSPRHSDASNLGQSGGLGSSRSGAQAGGGRFLAGVGDNADERIGDIKFLLDHLQDVESQVPGLESRLDSTRVAMTGHSYGAFVSIALGGVTVVNKGKTVSYRDGRIKALIPISASGIGEFGLTKDSWASASLPTLYFSGTRDTRPGHPIDWRRDSYLNTKTNVTLLTIDGANHFSYGGRGPAAVTALVQKMSLAFLDIQLKGSKQDLKTVLGYARATLESK